jgi:hypothetical protein
MSNRLALQDLAVFIQNPRILTASALTRIPALHNALLYEFTTYTHVSNDLLDICTWFYNRGREVFLSLTSHNTKMPEVTEVPLEEENWQEVNFFVNKLALISI